MQLTKGRLECLSLTTRPNLFKGNSVLTLNWERKRLVTSLKNGLQEIYHNSKTKSAGGMLLQDFDNYDMDCKWVNFGELMKCFRAYLGSLIEPPFLVEKWPILVNCWGTMFWCLRWPQNEKLCTLIMFCMLRYVIKSMFTVCLNFFTLFLRGALLLLKVKD